MNQEIRFRFKGEDTTFLLDVVDKYMPRNETQEGWIEFRKYLARYDEPLENYIMNLKDSWDKYQVIVFDEIEFDDYILYNYRLTTWGIEDKCVDPTDPDKDFPINILTFKHETQI